MEPTPSTDGDPGTPPPAGSSEPGQQHQGGQQYGGSPDGPPPYQGGPPQYSGMPPMQGMPQGPPPGRPQTTSAAAVIAFVFSIIGGILISVILAIVALSRMPSRNQKGKGFAIAALVISGVWVVGLIAGAALLGDREPDRDATGQVTATQAARPDKLRVGDCVTEIKEGEVSDVKIQPCNQPNGGKVFAVFELPAGDWPGLEQVQASAEKGCTDRWEASKQEADQPSSIFFLHPVEDSWGLGDRGVTCVLAPN